MEGGSFGAGRGSSRGHSDVNTQFHNGTGPLFGPILMLRSHFITVIQPMLGPSVRGPGLLLRPGNIYHVCVRVCIYAYKSVLGLYRCVQVLYIMCGNDFWAITDYFIKYYFISY